MHSVIDDSYMGSHKYTAEVDYNCVSVENAMIYANVARQYVAVEFTEQMDQCAIGFFFVFEPRTREEIPRI